MMMPPLFWRLIAFLATRGHSVTLNGGQRFALRDDGDGPKIVEWVEAVYGPWPTDQELAAISQAQEDAARDASADTLSLATSRQKDILTTCALIVRARNVAAWNAMTLQQKKDAALVEADVWKNLRAFVERLSDI